MQHADIATSPESAPTSTLSTLGAEGIHEFIRYFVASLVALIIDVGSLWVLTSLLGVPYLLSGAVAFTLGVITVYILSVRWVFSERMVRNPHLEFLLFAGIGLVGLGINELVLWALTSIGGVFYLVSKMASVVVVFSWNFAARKWLLFRVRT